MANHQLLFPEMYVDFASSVTYKYFQLLKQLEANRNATKDMISSFKSYILMIYRSEQQNRFSEPMLWIGFYIALASLVCALAMVADLLHGLLNRKFWFPSKYFTLNAASLAVVAVAMKLPVDLNNSMPGKVDQAAKLGSMAFMCTIMANFLPSLATMNNRELLTNIIALGVLVITLVVNVCIQIATGVVSYSHDEHFVEPVWRSSTHAFDYHSLIAIFYVVMLLFLLIIHASSALMILRSKEILEQKYKDGHATASTDLDQQQPQILNVERLKKHVIKYWIMSRIGSPQFVIASSAMSSASGVLCVFSTAFHFYMFFVFGFNMDHRSDYKWSMFVILMTQFIGGVLGTIAPLSRCFTSLHFKLSVNWIQNHMKVLIVERYWTQKLSDWEQSSIPCPLSSHKGKIVLDNLKTPILNFCIVLQRIIVVVCKTLRLFPVILIICFHCWKWLKATFIAETDPAQRDNLGPYVLQLEDDMELSERTFIAISKTVDRLIQKAEKQQPRNLVNLLEQSGGFAGVRSFDSQDVKPILTEEPFNCWSLTLVTLTSIAMYLPNIQTNVIDSLQRSVREGLVYVTLVEESLNTIDDHVRIQNAAKALWIEIEEHCKWLDKSLKGVASQVHSNSPGRILRWLSETAENMIIRTDTGGPEDERSISANSMYYIAKTILLPYGERIDEVNEDELFLHLSSMIGDILAACFTNLPRIIAMKCYASEVKKREASVRAAAQLLGETMHIIGHLKGHNLPGLSRDDMVFIDRWGVHLNPRNT